MQVLCQMTVKAVSSNDLTPFHQSLEYQFFFYKSRRNISGGSQIFKTVQTVEQSGFIFKRHSPRIGTHQKRQVRQNVSRQNKQK